MKVTILHNPRCSKSRATLALLQERGIDAVVVPYLETPPSAARLRTLLKLLDMAPLDLMRRQEAPFRELGLDRPGLGDAELVDAMARHPVLIERPIVVVERNGSERAALGRPPEAVLALL